MPTRLVREHYSIARIWFSLLKRLTFDADCWARRIRTHSLHLHTLPTLPSARAHPRTLCCSLVLNARKRFARPILGPLLFILYNVALFRTPGSTMRTFRPCCYRKELCCMW